jgi:transcriptional regulator with XRE-family HTH domain
MNDRIAKILEEEGMTATRFADEIGVQASSISHIISGRNKPSTDFLIKLLERFRRINAEWLLTGRGNPYKESSQEPDLPNNNVSDLFNSSIQNMQNSPKTVSNLIPQLSESENVDKIVIFYNNNTFKTYFPA